MLMLMTATLLAGNSGRRRAYKNGNYVVIHEMFSNTLIKRAFRFGEELEAEFPDSIDLKLTNKCGWGCKYCHENSTPDGKSFDLAKTKEILRQLPDCPIEIAIGGGNIFECPDEVLELIQWMKNSRGFLPRCTINYRDILQNFNLSGDDPRTKIIKEVGAIGLSISEFPNELYVDDDESGFLEYHERHKVDSLQLGRYLAFRKSHKVVYQVIVGLIPTKDLERLLYEEEDYPVPVLFLGYKQFGRALGTEFPKKFEEQKNMIRACIINRFSDVRDERIRQKSIPAYKSMSSPKIKDPGIIRTIGFDNLAIEQLGINELVPEEDWKYVFLGKEGTCSMYIDAVSGTYALNSYSTNKTSWETIGLLDFFKNLKNE